MSEPWRRNGVSSVVLEEHKKRVRQMLGETEMSLKQIAPRVGVSVQAISKFNKEEGIRVYKSPPRR